MASMGEREYRWSERGRRSAAHFGVGLHEVIEALQAPEAASVEREVGDLVVIEGMADSGRVILVIAERMSRNLNVFRILLAKPLGPEALDRWRKELP